MSPEASRALDAFMEAHGERADELLVMLLGLMPEPLAEGSAVAAQAARVFDTAKLPYALVVKRDPQSKSDRKRTDLQLITGHSGPLMLELRAG